METKWTGKGLGITVGFSLIYFVITMLVMMSGSFTPLTWIFMTALIGLLAGVPYMYITAREQIFGVSIIMNLIVGLIYFIAGELSNLVIVTLIASAILAEIIRKLSGYKSLKGNLCSYILFAFGMSGSPIYIWAFRDYTIQKAAKEMSAEYAASIDAMATPFMLAVMIAATIILAIIGGLIGEAILKKKLSIVGVK